jgi:hypothetical protein
VKTKATKAEQRRISQLVGRAVRYGKLIRKPCEVCGATKRIHAHHDDYDRPLDVRWLCASHHLEAHGKPPRPRHPKLPPGVFGPKRGWYIAADQSFRTIEEAIAALRLKNEA